MVSICPKASLQGSLHDDLRKPKWFKNGLCYKRSDVEGEPAGITRTRIHAPPTVNFRRARRTAAGLLACVPNKRSWSRSASGSVSCVSLSESFSNPLIQTLDALASLYQLLTAKFTFWLWCLPLQKVFEPVPTRLAPADQGAALR